MKNTIKFLGIIALVAIIGFSFTACGDDDDDNSGGNNTTTTGRGNKQPTLWSGNDSSGRDYSITLYRIQIQPNPVSENFAFSLGFEGENNPTSFQDANNDDSFYGYLQDFTLTIGGTTITPTYFVWDGNYGFRFTLPTDTIPSSVVGQDKTIKVVYTKNASRPFKFGPYEKSPNGNPPSSSQYTNILDSFTIERTVKVR